MRGDITPISTLVSSKVVEVAVEAFFEGGEEASATNLTSEGDTEKLIGERNIVSTASKEKRLFTMQQHNAYHSQSMEIEYLEINSGVPGCSQ